MNENFQEEVNSGYHKNKVFYIDLYSILIKNLKYVYWIAQKNIREGKNYDDSRIIRNKNSLNGYYNF